VVAIGVHCVAVQGCVLLIEFVYQGCVECILIVTFGFQQARKFAGNRVG
jgi:hypothetical protein